MSEEKKPLSQIPPGTPRLDRVYTGGGFGFEIGIALLVLWVLVGIALSH